MNQQEHAQLRSQFPALAQEVNGHPLIYLDNAATTQKPQAVLDAIAHYYRADNANVHRAAHALSGRATRAFEAARETVARFINAPNSREVIWTRGTTEAINLVSYAWAAPRLQPELLAHQRGAAADGALVHRQGTGGLGLRSGELQQVEHMQVLQGLGRGVGREVAP